ncbi:hypothetical protein [Alpinimonas psychrophila]|uniref:Uncharacterized protein n=1 Tax=Alpinimonas psychrophila TaxID=748908 RepID=A0A7W3PN16_9MICO|nr:hypothetical protein [Alpinimonas psychrophila]MBA8828002.1 hypothetical protein [Alpinimonas psychrophila]
MHAKVTLPAWADQPFLASDAALRSVIDRIAPDALDALHLWLGEQRTLAERQADRLGIHLIRTAPKGI